jgi:hypothetical protein
MRLSVYESFPKIIFAFETILSMKEQVTYSRLHIAHLASVWL